MIKNMIYMIKRKIAQFRCLLYAKKYYLYENGYCHGAPGGWDLCSDCKYRKQ